MAEGLLGGDGNDKLDADRAAVLTGGAKVPMLKHRENRRPVLSPVGA